MKLVIASNNPHKAVEIEQVLSELDGLGEPGRGITVVPAPPQYAGVVEDGETLIENARKKAVACAAITGEASLADDTGLLVDALAGAPGVRTARYAGENATDAQNRQKLLAQLAGAQLAGADASADASVTVSVAADTDPATRAARFCTVVVLRLADEQGTELIGQGQVEGSIATEEKGTGGFGYDSLFIPNEGDGRTFAEMTASQKNAVSHRARALRNLAEHLAKYRW